MPRIPPLVPDEWPSEMLEAIEGMLPPNPRHPEPDRTHHPRAPGVMETFAHHTALAKVFMAFNGHVIANTTLTPRHRHFLILRVATRRRSQVVWGQHVFQARAAGISDEEIARLAFGPDAPFFTPLETALLRALDELVEDGAISADTWEVLAAELDPQQLLDVIFTAGCYETVSWFMRSIELVPDPAIPELLAKDLAK